MQKMWYVLLRIWSLRRWFNCTKCKKMLLWPKCLQETWKSPHRTETIQILKVWVQLLTFKSLTWEDTQEIKPFRGTKCSKSFFVPSALKKHEGLTQKPFKFQKPSGVQGGVRWLLLLGLPTLSFTGPVPFLPVSLFLFPYTYTTVVLYAYVFSYPTKRFKEALMYPHWRETIQVHKVWQKLLTIKSFIDTWEDPHRRKTIQVHKVWQELLISMHLEDTWEDPHRREAIQL